MECCKLITLKDCYPKTFCEKQSLTARSIKRDVIKSYENDIKEKIRSHSFPLVRVKSTFDRVKQETSTINPLRSASLPDIGEGLVNLPSYVCRSFRGKKLVADIDSDNTWQPSYNISTANIPNAFEPNNNGLKTHKLKKQHQPSFKQSSERLPQLPKPVKTLAQRTTTTNGSHSIIHHDQDIIPAEEKVAKLDSGLKSDSAQESSGSFVNPARTKFKDKQIHVEPQESNRPLNQSETTYDTHQGIADSSVKNSVSSKPFDIVCEVDTSRNQRFLKPKPGLVKESDSSIASPWNPLNELHPESPKIDMRNSNNASCHKATCHKATIRVHNETEQNKNVSLKNDKTFELVRTKSVVSGKVSVESNGEDIWNSDECNEFQDLLKIGKPSVVDMIVNNLMQQKRDEYGNRSRVIARGLMARQLTKKRETGKKAIKPQEKYKDQKLREKFKSNKKKSKGRRKVTKQQCERTVEAVLQTLVMEVPQLHEYGTKPEESEFSQEEVEIEQTPMEEITHVSARRRSSFVPRRASVVPSRKFSLMNPVVEELPINQVKHVTLQVPEESVTETEESSIAVEEVFSHDDFLSRNSLTPHLQVRRLSMLLKGTGSISAWQQAGVTPFHNNLSEGSGSISFPKMDTTTTHIAGGRTPSSFVKFKQRKCVKYPNMTSRVQDKQFPNLYIRTVPIEYITLFKPEEIVFKKSKRQDHLYLPLDEKVYVDTDDQIISTIKTKVERFVKSLIKEVGKRDERLKGTLIGAGSMYEKLRVATCPLEFDFMVELTSPSSVEFKTCNFKDQKLPEVEVKNLEVDDDFHPGAVKSLFQTEYHNYFAELCHNGKVKGYFKATNFGIKFLYSLSNIPIEIDLVPCIKLGRQTSEALRSIMHPHVKENSFYKVGPWTLFHMIFKDGDKLRISTSFAEGCIIRNLDEESRRALRILKYLSLLSFPSNTPLSDSISTYQLKTFWLTTVLTAKHAAPSRKATTSGILRYISQALEKVTEAFRTHNTRNREAGKVFQDHFMFPYPVDMVRDNTYSTHIKKVVGMAKTIVNKGIRQNDMSQLERYTDPFERYELHKHILSFLVSKETRKQVLKKLFEKKSEIKAVANSGIVIP